MSTVKTNKVQIGQSGTASQNFTITTPATPDGTMRIHRGNAGAEGAELVKVNANDTLVVKQEVWQPVSFLNGWVNYDTNYNQAGYFKDSNGIVHLKGLVKLGTMPSTIFVLPVGYRPTHINLFVTISNQAIGRCDVRADGSVFASLGHNNWFSLDGISFRAEQ